MNRKQRLQHARSVQDQYLSLTRQGPQTALGRWAYSLGARGVYRGMARMAAAGQAWKMDPGVVIHIKFCSEDAEEIRAFKDDIETSVTRLAHDFAARGEPTVLRAVDFAAAEWGLDRDTQ